MAALAREGRATELAGVGKTLEEKIVALVETGEIPAAVKLRARYPTGLVDDDPPAGLGPKRARRLFDELGIDSLDALREAAEAHRIRDLSGFGEKAEANILEAIAGAPAARRRPGRCSTARWRSGRRSSHAARAPGLRARRAGGLGPALDRHGQGPRHRRHGQ